LDGFFRTSSPVAPDVGGSGRLVTDAEHVKFAVQRQ
jgi:hypothetical protein